VCWVLCYVYCALSGVCCVTVCVVCCVFGGGGVCCVLGVSMLAFDILLRIEYCVLCIARCVCAVRVM